MVLPLFAGRYAAAMFEYYTKQFFFKNRKNTIDQKMSLIYVSKALDMILLLFDLFPYKKLKFHTLKPSKRYKKIKAENKVHLDPKLSRIQWRG